MTLVNAVWKSLVLHAKEHVPVSCSLVFLLSLIILLISCCLSSIDNQISYLPSSNLVVFILIWPGID